MSLFTKGWGLDLIPKSSTSHVVLMDLPNFFSLMTCGCGSTRLSPPHPTRALERKDFPRVHYDDDNHHHVPGVNSW